MNGQDKLVKAAKRCWNSCVCKSVYVWDMYLFTFLFYINSEVHPEVQQLFFSYTFLTERLPHSWAQVFGFAFLKCPAVAVCNGIGALMRIFFFFTQNHTHNLFSRMYVRSHRELGVRGEVCLCFDILIVHEEQKLLVIKKF